MFVGNRGQIDDTRNLIVLVVVVKRARYDVEHLFPFSYQELLPYYEWVERTLPIETAPLGLKEERALDRCPYI